MSESQLIEYKESWRDEYLKWIYDFVNTQSGVLFIGKRDEDLIDVIKITVEENPYPQNYKGDYHFVKIGVFLLFCYIIKILWML